MKLNDKCWRLNQHSGIRETTVADATRGDSTNLEFFTTEAEAWKAEADRCGKDAYRYEEEALRARDRQAQALKNAGEKRPTP
jgi:hypothetical protein